MPLLRLNPTDPPALAMMDAQERELVARYDNDEGSSEPFYPGSLAGGMLLGFGQGSKLLGIGGLKPWSEQPGSAEVKRMYVVPEARGRGLSKLILNGLIAWAREHGMLRLVLETGDRQPEAIKLYTTAGFTQIPNFGYYANLNASLCFELRLGNGVLSSERELNRRTARRNG